MGKHGLALIVITLLGLAVSSFPSARAQGRVAAPAALHVVTVLPAAGSTGVPAGGLVAIQFDRAVVALGQVGQPGPPPVTISPVAHSQGHWVTTSLWVLDSAATGDAGAGVQPATHYVITTRAGLRAIDGTALDHRTTWSFDTLRPEVVSYAPTDPHAANPVGPIQLTFNQLVDHASAQQDLSVVADSRSITGHVVWSTTASGNPAVPRASVLSFYPRGALPAHQSVTVVLRSGVRGVSGPLAMAQPIQWTFGVAGTFVVVNTQPSNGASNIDLNQINGGVTIHFSSPLNQSQAASEVRVSPSIQDRYISFNDNQSLTINGGTQPSTRYTVTLLAGLRDLYGRALGHTYRFAFRTAPATPSVQFYSYGTIATFSTYRGVRFYALAVNEPSVTYALYRVDHSTALRMLDPSFDWNSYAPNQALMLRQWSVATQGKPNQSVAVGQVIRDASNHLLASGFYYLTIVGADNSASARDAQAFMLTTTSLTVKVAQHQVLVWATDLNTGRPVSHVSVALDDLHGTTYASGTTAADGVWTSSSIRPLPSSVSYDNALTDGALMVVAHRTGDVSLASTYWNSGIAPYDYNLGYSPTQLDVRLTLDTERPIYRPGQPVDLRGMARRDHDGRYSLLPTGTKIQVVVTDPLGHTIFNQQQPINRFGTFDALVPLSVAAALGTYNLSAQNGASYASASFQVAAYRKPTFAISVQTNRPAYTQGQRLTALNVARYYFGAPLARAPVAWDVLTSDLPFSSPAYPDYNFVDFDTYASLQPGGATSNTVTQGTGQTNDQGQFVFSVTASTTGHPVDQQYTVETTVQDVNHEQVSQRTQVTIHQSLFYIGLRPENFVVGAGQSQKIDVMTVNQDGVTPQPNATMRVRLYQRQWVSAYVQDPATGSFYWTNQSRDSLISSQIAKTGSRGAGMFAVVPPKPGEYRVLAQSTDAQGHPVSTATYLWVTGDGFTNWGIQNNDRITLVPDRSSYQAGQTARILVAAPLRNMTALLTIERGTIVTHRVLILTSNSTLIPIPISAAYVPDIYVSVVLTKGPGKDTSLPVWKMGYAHLVVDPAAGSLLVSVHPSVARATPGQRVTFRIRTTTRSGRGVPADVSLALVDAAILALAQDQNASLFNTFYGDRPLGIDTADTLSLYIDRLNLEQGFGAKGGSGGGAGGVSPPTRKYFPDTAYWNPHVFTDNNGNATVSLVLPDSLTTWTMTVQGTTGASTLVGSGSSSLIVTQNLLVQSALPRFLMVHDSAQIGAVIDNLTNQAAPVVVSMVGFPATPRQVTVAAHGQQLVTWPITVSGSPRDVTITLRAHSTAGPALSDAMQVTVPVVANSTPETAGTAGIADTAMTTELLSVPATAVAGEGSLTVVLAPTLLANLTQATVALDQIPFADAESLVNRMVGEAVLASAEHGVALPRGLAVNLPRLVATTLQQLYGFQNGDGGFGWWSGDISDPVISVNVVDGLITMRHLGYRVDASVLSQAENYLHSILTSGPQGQGGGAGSPLWWYYLTHTQALDVQAYIADVLARAGHGDLGMTQVLAAHPEQLATIGLAYLTQAMAIVTGDPQDARVQTLLATLSSRVRLDALSAHWQAATADYYLMATDTGTTAVALQTLAQLDPGSPLIQPAARWLLGTRMGGTWATSADTKLAIQGLTSAQAGIKSAPPSYHYNVTLNGVSLGAGAFSPSGNNQTLTIQRSLPGPGPLRLTIARSGGGQPAIGTGHLYYTIAMTYYRSVETIAPLAEGVAVQRTYSTVSSLRPISGGRAGDTVRVHLTVVATQSLYYFHLNDPLPAGAETVDTSLQTSSVAASLASSAYQPQAANDLGLYVGHSEVGDRGTSLFAYYLPAGTYSYSYVIHLTTSGVFHALPTLVEETYFPTVFGRGQGSLFTVR